MMRNKRVLLAATAVIGALALSGVSVEAQQDEEPPPMGFFVTSGGIGDGAALGGLEGADAHCQSLAAAVGGGDRTWQAYLSTQGPGAVDARDRIGDGPWANANGLVMATSVENLHYDNSNLNWEFSLDENGEQFPSRIDGDPDFTEHDVLTGSQIDGTAFPAGDDRTCGNLDGSRSPRHGAASGLGQECLARWIPRLFVKQVAKLAQVAEKLGVVIRGNLDAGQHPTVV